MNIDDKVTKYKSGDLVICHRLDSFPWHFEFKGIILEPTQINSNYYVLFSRELGEVRFKLYNQLTLVCRNAEIPLEEMLTHSSKDVRRYALDMIRRKNFFKLKERVKALA